MKFIRDIIRSLTMDKVDQVSNHYIKLLNDMSIKIWKTDPEAEANIENYAKEAVSLLEKFHADILGVSVVHKEEEDVIIKHLCIPIIVTATYTSGAERDLVLWELKLAEFKSGKKVIDICTKASDAELHSIAERKGTAWTNITRYQTYAEAKAWANNRPYNREIINL